MTTSPSLMKGAMLCPPALNGRDAFGLDGLEERNQGSRERGKPLPQGAARLFRQRSLQRASSFQQFLDEAQHVLLDPARLPCHVALLQGGDHDTDGPASVQELPDRGPGFVEGKEVVLQVAYPGGQGDDDQGAVDLRATTSSEG